MDENTNPTLQEVEVPAADSDTAAGTAATTAPSAAEEQKPAAAPAEEPPEAAEQHLFPTCAGDNLVSYDIEKIKFAFPRIRWV